MQNWQFGQEVAVITAVQGKRGDLIFGRGCVGKIVNISETEVVVRFVHWNGDVCDIRFVRGSNGTERDYGEELLHPVEQHEIIGGLHTRAVADPEKLPYAYAVASTGPRCPGWFR